MAYILGASSGIGRAVCQVFAREGARLVAVDNQKKGLESVLSLPGTPGESVHMLVNIYVGLQLGLKLADLL